MKLHQKLFVLLIFLLPVQLGKHFWPDFSLIFGIRVDYLSPTIYLTDILVLLLLMLWGVERLKNSKFKIAKSKYTFKILKRFLFPFLVFCFLLVNAFLAQNQGAAFYKLLKITEFGLLGLYIAKNKLLITKYQLPITLAVIYSSLIAIAQFINQASLGGIFWLFGERTFNIQTPAIALGEVSGRLFLRPYGTFSHPNSLAGFTLIVLILLLGNAKSTNQLIHKLSYLLGLLALVLSFSRSAWLAGVISILLLTAHQIWKKRIGTLLIAFFIIFLIFFIILFSCPRFLIDEPLVQRLQLIKVSYEMIKSNPLSGVGLNNFIVRLPDFWESNSIRLLQPVHNIYLLIATETGLVGLAIFLWFLILTIRRLLHYRLTRLLVALNAILLLGLFDHYWLTLQQNQLLFSLVLGLIWNGEFKKG